MLRLDTSTADFASAFAGLVSERREADEDVSRDVAAILARVKADGDPAVAALTEKFDGHRLDWQISVEAAKNAYDALDPALRDALEYAAKRILHYHAKQVPPNSDEIDDAGVRIGARWRAVEAAGVYVPGGRAAYPSSVLMNIIPAKVAGVDRIVMVTPAPGGVVNPAVLAAAYIAGVDEIWRIGGAQAVAALAYGTQTIAPVDVITGPGNAWVAEAKRQLYGVVGIDMVAGPSEILVRQVARRGAGHRFEAKLAGLKEFAGHLRMPKDSRQQFEVALTLEAGNLRCPAVQKSVRRADGIGHARRGTGAQGRARRPHAVSHAQHAGNRALRARARRGHRQCDHRTRAGGDAGVYADGACGEWQVRRRQRSRSGRHRQTPAGIALHRRRQRFADARAGRAVQTNRRPRPGARAL